MEASEPMMPDAWATTLWAMSNTAMTRFQVLVTSKIAAADLNTHLKIIQIMQVVAVGNHLDQLQRHHDGQDHASNRHHDGVGKVLDHTENAAVPPLRGLAHLRGDVRDLLVHTVEHPR